MSFLVHSIVSEYSHFFNVSLYMHHVLAGLKKQEQLQTVKLQVLQSVLLLKRKTTYFYKTTKILTFLHTNRITNIITYKIKGPT